jgi:hypothetical protein
MDALSQFVKPTSSFLTRIQALLNNYGEENLHISLRNSSNQSHGQLWDDLIRMAFYPTELTYSATGKWDVYSVCDKIHNLNTNIKTIQGDTIYLSDARRIFEINETFRLVLVNYEQVGDWKVFTQLLEYWITPDHLKSLFGSIQIDCVERIHNGIASFGPGEENAKQARAYAKAEIEKLKDLGNAIQLNPKIDSKNQRRLQCSVSKKDLSRIVEPVMTYELEASLFKVWSPPRKRKDKSVEADSEQDTISKQMAFSFVPKLTPAKEAKEAKDNRFKIALNSETKLWEIFDQNKGRKIGASLHEINCPVIIKGYLKKAS